jgi:4-amino-4-deoxychorismate lyase
MSRFIETIQLLEGQFLNLPFHQQRIKRTLEVFFPGEKNFGLEDILKDTNYPPSGKHRFTLTYSIQPLEFRIIPYAPKKITRLLLRSGDYIDYGFKYADRSELNRLLEGLGPEDEVIIMKNGLVTDASYANLAFYDGKDWFTPDAPLLHGTKRQQLIDKAILHETRIPGSDIHRYHKCSLVNAMLDLGEVEINCRNIF